MSTPTRGPYTLAPLLLIPGGLALLAGLDAALTLAGLPAPASSQRLAVLHGSLMVLAFLGTVISLERAVALRQAWGFLAPGLIGLGGIALIVLPDPLLGRLLLVHGFVLFVAVYAVLWRRNHDHTIAVQALGAVLAACAALLLTRVEVAVVLPLLIVFIVLTIGAERVELARLAMPAAAGVHLIWWSVACTAAAAATVLWPLPGWRLLGLILLGMTLWLVRHDVARRLIKTTGLPRFAAAALLLGYAWLLLAGVVLVLVGQPTEAAYDVVVHATFLGFAMSMILAHAPVILPAVLRVKLPYNIFMWVPLALLHLTLLIRVVAVTLDDFDGWSVGLYGNVVALLIFVATAVLTGFLAARPPKPRPFPTPARAAEPAQPVTTSPGTTSPDTSRTETTHA
ncbi:MAG: hypothetical protein Q4P07_02610 [Ornithinimicrobium sp.]|uniref:hypothetical protein n=1 Tax=Ornithinimicrobium sp. TaxID=1977084 RepID=UPI0026DEC2FA|nr:hypothetical protein [Ornithinimicrobium sp.]MDO5739020.1 hypothetical protein [Ornithinimicrobium sp.]